MSQILVAEKPKPNLAFRPIERGLNGIGVPSGLESLIEDAINQSFLEENRDLVVTPEYFLSPQWRSNFRYMILVHDLDLEMKLVGGIVAFKFFTDAGPIMVYDKIFRLAEYRGNGLAEELIKSARIKDYEITRREHPAMQLTMPSGCRTSDNGIHRVYGGLSDYSEVSRNKRSGDAYYVHLFGLNQIHQSKPIPEYWRNKGKYIEFIANLPPTMLKKTS